MTPHERDPFVERSERTYTRAQPPEDKSAYGKFLAPRGSLAPRFANLASHTVSAGRGSG